MAERKTLKRQLSKLKHYQRSLPRLIDCSDVYGDNSFTKEDLKEVAQQIEKKERLINEIDKSVKPIA